AVAAGRPVGDDDRRAGGDQRLHARPPDPRRAADDEDAGGHEKTSTGLIVAPLAASATAVAMSSNSYVRISLSTGNSPRACISSRCGRKSCGTASPSMTP